MSKTKKTQLPPNNPLLDQIVAYFQSKGADNCSARFYFAKPKQQQPFCIVRLHRSSSIGSLCSFANLNWLSQLLGTEEINMENYLHKSGCPTCDYGSHDEMEIVCSNIKALFSDGK